MMFPTKLADCKNSTDTNDTPSREVEFTVEILSMLEIASSIGFVTDVSISLGEAPG
jgi:hypothetical protein